MLCRHRCQCLCERLSGAHIYDISEKSCPRGGRTKITLVRHAREIVKGSDMICYLLFGMRVAREIVPAEPQTSFHSAIFCLARASAATPLPLMSDTGFDSVVPKTSTKPQLNYRTSVTLRVVNDAKVSHERNPIPRHCNPQDGLRDEDRLDSREEIIRYEHERAQTRM